MSTARSTRQPHRRLAGRLGALAAAMASATVAVPSVAHAATADATARQSYISAADKVCEASNTKLVAAAKDYEKHLVIIRRGAKVHRHKVAKPVEVATFVKKVAVPELTSQWAQLALLQPPAADKATVAEFFKSAKSILATIEKKPTEAAYADPFKKLGKQMKDYGFSSCGQPAAFKDL